MILVAVSNRLIRVDLKRLMTYAILWEREYLDASVFIINSTLEEILQW